MIKGFGIRANRDIPAETFIIEYVGEVLDNKQFEKRAKKYSENKNTHYYFMALKSNAIIDATKKGNISRFINHSCDPNAETQKWTVNGELRVGFFSRKDVKAGEEITFDYQYQRYGKEAQKCYCGAGSCRGWIGENPLDDEGADEEEAIEVDDSKAKKTKPRKGRKSKTALDKSEPELEVKEESASEEESPKAPAKKREIVRKPAAKLKKQIDDMEIEGEINELTESGLKNRLQTIKLSRLIVRAKNVQARSRLLKILINGDLPCRRLFLDYNGLNLMHNWMSDINVKISTDDLGLCIEMMNALERLPIFNKTVLKTSKVLDRVEKWKNLDLEKKKLTKEEKKQAKAEKKKKEMEDGDKKGESGGEDIAKLDGENPESAMDTSQTNDENALDELMKMKLQAKKVASELLEKWEELKEDFKIPKKQKQENRIEHEREADNDDWEDENVVHRGDVLLNTDRYKNRFGDDSAQSGGGTRTFTAPHKKQGDPMVSKQQRRQMFEMKVQQFDTEKRMMMLHENNCAIFGLNPNTTNPLDVPVRVNRVTGEYLTIDGRIAPPPPNHYQFKYEPLTLSTNPDDYFLPPIDLPEHWRYALDEFGRIYYYHEKIRQSQWEAPIKILPLKMNTESDLDSPDSDESTTDTEDSEEEELRELLEMLKRKKLLPPVQQTPVNPLILQSGGGDGDEDELEKKIMNNMMQNPVDHPLKISQAPQKRLKKKRHGLTTIQFIRPRTEADKLYGRAESRRYKEVKEKLRQKKRRILKGEAGPDDGSSEDEDDIALGDTVGKFVDELDILEKSKLDGKCKNTKEVDKKAKKPKPVVVDQVEVKRQFRDDIKREIGKFLQPYREDSCEKGKITNDVDFASLVNKVRLKLPKNLNRFSTFFSFSSHSQFSRRNRNIVSRQTAF
jgi:[histone H3]-lysine36 N-trimethyltransferase